MTNWRLLLSEFNIDVAHLAEIKHHPCDALSCVQTTGADTKSMEDDISYAVMGTEKHYSAKLCIELDVRLLTQDTKYNDWVEKAVAPTMYTFLQI